jgi:hypothetical protein
VTNDTAGPVTGVTDETPLEDQTRLNEPGHSKGGDQDGGEEDLPQEAEHQGLLEPHGSDACDQAARQEARQEAR